MGGKDFFEEGGERVELRSCERRPLSTLGAASDFEYVIVGAFLLPSVPPMTGDRPGDLERGRFDDMVRRGELLSNLDGSR